MQTEQAETFTKFAAGKLQEQLAQIVRCASLLTTDELWRRANVNTNSVANLVLHLTGNVSQWILAGLADEPIVRDRPGEFAARDGRPAIEIVPPLEQAVRRAIGVIERLGDDDLARSYTIQRYKVVGQIAVFHVVEHFSFHTGQIVHITKWIKDVDLSLYDSQGQKLNDTRAP